MEVCETINKKQGSAPRIAAQAIVRLVNSTKVNQAMLALTLLDNCVKNCGYPFHLQIASKEFLNNLVRRFPERPPARYAPNPVQSAPENQWNHFDYVPPQQFIANPVIDRILYLIKEWKVALTELSRYKEDMGHIKDMYRLLKFKGYQFPELRDSSIAALAPTETLKSAHELEEEDRLAKSAKLQELIRRGRPQDLVEANKLMKIMTGYDQKHQTNFKEKFAEELHKIQNKARLLYEMLDNVKEGDVIEEEGTMEELKNACESALPKIKNMLKDEEDNNKIDELNEVKSIIKGVVLKYQDIKHGRYDTEYDISGKFKSETNSLSDKNAPPQAISLIDLDDAFENTSSSSSPSAAPSSSKNALDELVDIFGEKTTVSSTNTSTPQQSMDPFDLLSQSIQSNTLPPSSPNLSNLNHTTLSSPAFTHITTTTTTTTASSSPASQEAKVQKSSKLPKFNLVNKNGLSIQLEAYSVGESWKLKAYYSNKSTAPMDKMTLLLAAPRSMHLRMSPASSDSVPPKSENLVTQTITIENPKKEQLRLKYKATYEQFGVEMEQSGDYHDN
ncbi:VHS domain-containing protein [Mucor ambiguus]|uniref:VHS domain-containing protein n=1 Tax=Mucor ambiguus TaxID=91626 RepID=A0A0C9MJ18_9FUNG|nr:VHS domain-containing protein [Mucor ambiguus]